MILLKDKTNVTAPNVNYPYGDIKDNTGIGDGTPVNRRVYADFHQFFSKLFNNSGLVANGLPDNEENGFQLFEALLRVETNQSKQNKTDIKQIEARLNGGDFNSF